MWITLQTEAKWVRANQVLSMTCHNFLHACAASRFNNLTYSHHLVFLQYENIQTSWNSPVVTLWFIMIDTLKIWVYEFFRLEIRWLDIIVATMAGLKFQRIIVPLLRYYKFETVRKDLILEMMGCFPTFQGQLGVYMVVKCRLVWSCSYMYWAEAKWFIRQYFMTNSICRMAIGKSTLHNVKLCQSNDVRKVRIWRRNANLLNRQ